jgi:dolichol-phosphate mannosyltransferase
VVVLCSLNAKEKLVSEARKLVALATYNERDNLARLVGELRRIVPNADVLIMDDNSPDGTGSLADSLAAADSHIHVIHRAGKLGLGTALLAIMRYAMEQNYDWLITMDADFSHQPSYLPNLLDGLEQVDVMIGSRYITGGGVENWPLSRRLMSSATNCMVRALLRLPVHDSSGNFRCYRVSLLRRANLDNLLSRGYSFQQEVLHRCFLAGARLGERPIVFVERRAGQSKANFAEIVGSATALLRLGWRARFRQSG